MLNEGDINVNIMSLFDFVRTRSSLEIRVRSETQR
jgi:hypothetical protein